MREVFERAGFAEAPRSDRLGVESLCGVDEPAFKGRRGRVASDTLGDLPGSALVQEPLHDAGAVEAPRFTPGFSGRPHLDLAAIPL